MASTGYPVVPVLMFHMVNDHAGNTPLPWLATPVCLMELYLKTLRKEGYTTISLRELYDRLDKGTPIPQRVL